MNFILQKDDVSVFEKRAVHKAAWLMDGVTLIAPALLLDDLRVMPDGVRLSDRAVCPVGSVEFAREWMRVTGVTEPAPLDYPECLADALGRDVRRTTFGEASIGSWIKPYQTKAWGAEVKQDESAHPKNDLVWESPAIHPAEWLAEWRVYVINGKIIGVGRYDDKPDDSLIFNEALVESWVARYEAAGAPTGYALDVALWADGRTVLVEVTDGWAIGYYGGCDAKSYARLIHARWLEIAGG